MSKPAPMKVEPVTLEGQWVRLEPLSVAAHGEASVRLLERAPDLFRWFADLARTREDLLARMEGLLRQQAEGSVIAWATVEKATGQVVGSTTYLNIDRANHRLEIGNTWVAPDWQRTRINTEAKLLQLTHAFETLGCIRVELKTDALNTQSRQAIRRLGAKEEGIFRHHIIVADGRLRDTAYSSIIAPEWPGISEKLRLALAR